MKILEKLYYESIETQGHQMREKSELEKASTVLHKNVEKLIDTFSDEQKELFEKCKESSDKTYCILEKDSFINGFCFALRIAFEVINNQNFLFEL